MGFSGQYPFASISVSVNLLVVREESHNRPCSKIEKMGCECIENCTFFPQLFCIVHMFGTVVKTLLRMSTLHFGGQEFWSSLHFSFQLPAPVLPGRPQVIPGSGGLVPATVGDPDGAPGFGWAHIPFCCGHVEKEPADDKSQTASLPFYKK